MSDGPGASGVPRDRRLKVVFLDSWRSGPAQGSGTAVSISMLARELARRGHDVRTPRPSHGPAPRWMRRLVYNARVRRIGRGGDVPDLVVGFDLDGFLLPRTRPFPLVVFLKGVAADEARFARGAARIKLKAAARVEAGNARRADLVMVPSRYSAARAVESYDLDEARLRMIPEAVDPGPWAELWAVRADRDATGLARTDDGAAGRARKAGDRPTILSVARQYRRKNTPVLLEAVARLRSRIPGVRLRLVGGGPQLPRIRRRIRALDLEEAVDVLGAVPDTAEVRREYARADVFCLPSLQEGFGIAFLEAMSAGLPIVAGRTAAVPEVVPDGVAGLLVDPGSVEAVADALETLLTDPDRRRRMGLAGIEHARRFTPRAVGDAFEEAVRELVGDERVPGEAGTSDV